ncbi:TPA: hypothetical protein PP069_000845 [Serratia rubidaea]|uniref:DUF5862 family protein n=1 Tax=Serratia rubidaea TaxID=61652 RepID=UPI0023B03E83|nr:hypothetical protein [Serratia rubidaea]MDK1705939.1 hypothetical protein [Serratia rubidaea]HDJ1449162.1 hypothetical protein [Serratia rubidaea]HDJ1459709.1 hypothetical protein [Serratia rubidaea]HDJ2770997.1 hypothetical protein [Serratia rubidaea]
MRELTNKELTDVSGGTLDGMIWGIMDGIATGAGMVKYATGGGWLAGGIAQLIGIVVAPAIGGIAAGLLGLLTDRQTVADYAAQYRESMGQR